jgi:catechol 2,3-dioxygenase-like lactoylglutathione lyase family enzyme
MSTQTALLHRIGLVMVQTPDQDRSLEFYVGALGFEKRTDIAFGGSYRWVEVYPPGAATGIALAPPREGQAVTPKDTGIAINTNDIESAHSELKARGVDVDAEVSRMGDPVPPMFWLRDPDGHSLLIVEAE